MKSMISITEPSPGVMHHTTGLLGHKKSPKKKEAKSETPSAATTKQVSKTSTLPTTNYGKNLARKFAWLFGFDHVFRCTDVIQKRIIKF